VKVIAACRLGRHLPSRTSQPTHRLRF